MKQLEISRSGLELSLGPDHYETLASGLSLAGALYSLGDFRGARVLLEETFERPARVFGPFGNLTAQAAYGLGAVWTKSGYMAQATFYLKPAVASAEKTRETIDPAEP
jgi:hypothetical protein